MSLKRLFAQTLLGLCCVGPTASAQELPTETESILESFCGPFLTSGRAQSVGVSASAEAELKGLFRRVANIGGSAEALAEADWFQGVRQEDLVENLRDVAACRQFLWEDLKPYILPDLADAAPDEPRARAPLKYRQILLEGQSIGAFLKEQTQLADYMRRVDRVPLSESGGLTSEVGYLVKIGGLPETVVVKKYFQKGMLRTTTVLFSANGGSICQDQQACAHACQEHAAELSAWALNTFRKPVVLKADFQEWNPSTSRANVVDGKKARLENATTIFELSLQDKWRSLEVSALDGTIWREAELGEVMMALPEDREFFGCSVRANFALQ